MLGGVYLRARALDLGLTASLFQGFFAVLVLVLVVVFQDDLRRIFEQVGAWVSRRRGEEHPTWRLERRAGAHRRAARRRRASAR